MAKMKAKQLDDETVMELIMNYMTDEYDNDCHVAIEKVSIETGLSEAELYEIYDRN